MILFVVFKAVLVGALFGGLIFALISGRNNSEKIDTTEESLNSLGDATPKKTPSKIIASLKMMTKFIFTCFIVMGLLVIPFVILRVIL